MHQSEVEVAADDSNDDSNTAVPSPENELAVETTDAVEIAVETADAVQTTDNGFRSLGLSEATVATVASFGYSTPTPIQAQTIPSLLDGRDVLGQAQTGTGKTAAFALPLLERIDLSKKQPQVLVLAPTRELAIQVAEAFEKYASSKPGLRVVAIYGGQDYQAQLRPLNRGVHVVVGTPGRVMDHMRRRSLNLDELQCLVLDEADEMLRMGFADDVEWVLTQAPAQRQMALFSATLPKPIRKIAQKYLNNPAEITIKQKTATAETVNQRYVVVAAHQKQTVLARILESEPTDGVLVFVKTRATTEPLAEYLAQAGLKTAALNGDIPQKQRERIVDGLRSGKIDIIVATDVAARGLDVQRISHVVNYDLPYDSEAYVHRIGRTGRAGRSGEAILFVHPREERLLKRLEQATRQPIEAMDLPSNRDINKRRIEAFHEKITAALAHEDLDTFQSIVGHYQREFEVAPELIAAALAVIANGESPVLVKEKLKPARFVDDPRQASGDKRSRSAKRDFSSDRRSGADRTNATMETYRIEVGHKHQVKPGNIVGAIANEAGIGSSSIGKIKIFDHFSTVDLPQDFPGNLLAALQNVIVGGRKLQIARMTDARPRPARFQDSKRLGGKSSSKYRKKASTSTKT